MGKAKPAQEERLARSILKHKISSSCAFAAKVTKTNNDTETPRIVCVQDKKYKPYTRMIETSYRGELDDRKREDMKEIARETEDNVKMEVHYRDSPRGKTSRVVKKEGWSQEKVEEKIDEFENHHFDYDEWKQNNS